MSFKSLLAIVLGLTLSLCSKTVMATSVPISIVDALISNHGKAKLHIGKSSNSFPKLSLGNEFVLYGYIETKEFNHSSVIQLYSSKLNVGGLDDKIKLILNSNEWQIPEHFLKSSAMHFSSGFTTKTINRKFTSFLPYCHKTEGVISVGVSETATGSLLKLTHRPHSPHGMECNPPMQRMRMMDIQQLPLPKLELPEGVVSPAIGFGGSSGGNNHRSTSSEVNTKMSIEALYQHFVPQLNQQNWVQESSWLGGTSSGGHWLKQEDNISYITGVNIVRTGINSVSLEMWTKRLN